MTAFGASLRTNRTYRLVPGRHGDTGSPCAFDVVPVNNSLRFSNSRFVPNTSGRPNRPPGDWDIGFYEVEPGVRGRIAGLHAFFTVVA